MDKGVLKRRWKPAQGSAAKEVDTQINRTEVKKGLRESKNAGKKLSEEEKVEMAKRLVWNRKWKVKRIR